MTNKYIYFVANWKMFGNINSLNSLNNVIKFSKLSKKFKFKLIYCPPYTLLNLFFKKVKKSNISLGAQNSHYIFDSGAHTGSISPSMIKKIGAEYVIIGHSENRAGGESNFIINQKVKSCLKAKLKVILCIGESLKQRKMKLTNKVLKNQISKALEGIKRIDNIFFAYEPIWSIGTGIIPKVDILQKDVEYLKEFISKKYKNSRPKIIYGGSVNSKNIQDLRYLNNLDGFLIGGASQKAKNFIDIVKKSFI